MKNDLPSNYRDIVTLLKDKIRKARLNASFKLNADLLYMYKEIGTTIANQERKAGWGAKIIVSHFCKANLQNRLEIMDQKKVNQFCKESLQN